MLGDSEAEGLKVRILPGIFGNSVLFSTSGRDRR